MASLTGNPFINTYPASGSVDNDPIGFRDLVLAFRNNMSLELNDYIIGQVLTGAAGLNVGDMWWAAGTLAQVATFGTVATAAGTLVAVPFFTGNQPLTSLFLNGLAVNVTTLGA